MDVLKMLADLRAERQQIDEAILTLERLAVGTRGKRRGRPPELMSLAHTTQVEPTSPKRRTVSAAGRKRMAEAQKKRWAAIKAAAEPS